MNGGRRLRRVLGHLSSSRATLCPPAPVGSEGGAAAAAAGKTHPITGQPLEIVELELPPGSIVSCLSVRSLFRPRLRKL